MYVTGVGYWLKNHQYQTGGKRLPFSSFGGVDDPGGNSVARNLALGDERRTIRDGPLMRVGAGPEYWGFCESF
jgi:hypothetical protein